MHSLPPSEQVTKNTNALLGEERQEGENLVTELMKLGLQKLVQEVLETEVTTFLGRERYERHAGKEGTKETSGPWRNGYKDRSVRTAEGRVPVRLPQVRNSAEPYRSELWPHVKGNSDALNNLVIEMYARGLSTRDIEAAFTDPETKQRLLSKSQSSQITEALWEEYEAFTKRDLSSFDVVYMFLDAVYEPLRRFGRTKEAIMCCWGVLRDGSRVLIHMDLGRSETHDAWSSFLEDMVHRGLASPVTVTTDGSKALTRAVDETWSNAYRIRCWAHKMRNILAKVPKDADFEVRSHLGSIRDAADWGTGRQLATMFIEKYRDTFPRAVASFENDLEATLAHLRLPPMHRRTVRTTNLLERAFAEERRRTKVIPRFMDEKSGLKLAFATLWRVSQSWRGVRFSEHEFHQLGKLIDRVRSPELDEVPNEEVVSRGA